MKSHKTTGIFRVDFKPRIDNFVQIWSYFQKTIIAVKLLDVYEKFLM